VLTQTIGNLNVVQGYTYDGLNRLKTATELSGGTAPAVACVTGAIWCQQYVYDQYGNRTVLGADSPNYIPSNSQTPQVTTDRPSALAGLFPNNQSTICTTSDAAGNAQVCPAAPAVNYTFDAENRLVTADSTTFTYDGDGRRVMKANGSASTTYVYDAKGELAAE